MARKAWDYTDGGARLIMHLLMLCRRKGGGGRAWGGDLILFVGSGVGHWTDLVLPGEGYLNLSSLDVEIFNCRLGRKILRPNFHASRMRRTVSKDLKIMEAKANKRKQGGFHCFVFKFRLF